MYSYYFTQNVYLIVAVCITVHVAFQMKTEDFRFDFISTILFLRAVSSDVVPEAANPIFRFVIGFSARKQCIIDVAVWFVRYYPIIFQGCQPSQFYSGSCHEQR